MTDVVSTGVEGTLGGGSGVVVGEVIVGCGDDGVGEREGREGSNAVVAARLVVGG